VSILQYHLVIKVIAQPEPTPAQTSASLSAVAAGAGDDSQVYGI